MDSFITGGALCSNGVHLTLEQISEVILLQEAKQVGIVYHFTKLHNLMSAIKDSSFDTSSFDREFLMSRNRQMPYDNFGKNDFSVSNGYVVRITSSEKYILNVEILSTTESDKEFAGIAKILKHYKIPCNLIHKF